MFTHSYEELQTAVEIFGLIGLESRNEIKKKYLKLSKEFHPDKEGGSKERFQEIIKAHDILMEYLDGFKFRFTKEEFINQYPFSKIGSGDWIYKSN